MIRKIGRGYLNTMKLMDAERNVHRLVKTSSITFRYPVWDIFRNGKGQKSWGNESFCQVLILGAFS